MADGGFRHHGMYEGHQISFCDAQLQQGIGGLADLGMQLGVGEAARVGRVRLSQIR